MIRYNSFEKFTISSKPVTADYIHAGVFVPVFNASEETYRFTFSPLGNTATKLQYWDEEAWASELVVSTGSPKLGPASSEGQVRSAADQAAAAAEGEGLVKPGKEAEAKPKKRRAEASAATKQKKVLNVFLCWSERTLKYIIDCTCTSAILEQSACRASWRQALWIDRKWQ